MSVIALCLHPSFYLLVRSGQQEDWPCPCPFRYVPHVRLDLYCMTAGLNVRLELYTFIGWCTDEVQWLNQCTTDKRDNDKQTLYPYPLWLKGWRPTLFVLSRTHPLQIQVGSVSPNEHNRIKTGGRSQGSLYLRQLQALSYPTTRLALEHTSYCDDERPPLHMDVVLCLEKWKARRNANKYCWIRRSVYAFCQNLIYWYIHLYWYIYRYRHTTCSWFATCRLWDSTPR